MDVNEWLPRDALSYEAILACARGRVTGWPEDWFLPPVAGMTSLVCRRRDARHPPGEPAIRIHGSAMNALATEEGAHLVAAAAIGSPPDALTADKAFVNLFAERIIRDLVSRIDAALATGGPADDEPIILSLLIGGESAVRLESSVSAWARLVKRHSGEPAKREPAVPLARALEATMVALEALVGRAQLTVDDVREIAPGDVLVLDTALEDRVALRLAACGTAIAGGRLRFDGDEISVEL